MAYIQSQYIKVLPLPELLNDCNTKCRFFIKPMKKHCATFVLKCKKHGQNSSFMPRPFCRFLFLNCHCSVLLLFWDYDVSGCTWAEYLRAVDFYMGARMPVIALSCMGAMLLFLILNWQNRREKPFRFMLTALCIQILLTVIAINTNVDLNPIMNQWDPENLPTNWAAMRDEWLVITIQRSSSIWFLQLYFFVRYFFTGQKIKITAQKKL